MYLSPDSILPVSSSNPFSDDDNYGVTKETLTDSVFWKWDRWWDVPQPQ